tara:strand:+ start:10130 stop:10747 length:618 start_codon:yes stop_codon:yes gene_type:complete
MPTTKKSTFDTLYAVNVSDKIEKKGSLDYLSWASAWAEVKKVYPTVTYRVYENDAYSINYFHDGKYAYVKVGVTIDELEHINYLPVMDYRNKSIPLDKLTSMDVNTAIQRCLTKAIALHGLGLSIYNGEDISKEVVEVVDSKPKPKAKAKATTSKDLSISQENWTKVLTWAKQNKDNKQLIYDGIEKKKISMTSFMTTELNKILK